MSELHSATATTNVTTSDCQTCQKKSEKKAAKENKATMLKIELQAAGYINIS